MYTRNETRIHVHVPTTYTYPQYVRTHNMHVPAMYTYPQYTRTHVYIYVHVYTDTHVYTQHTRTHNTRTPNPPKTLTKVSFRGFKDLPKVFPNTGFFILFGEEGRADLDLD